MVDIRLTEFDNTIWGYVVENARIRRMSRKKALEEIIKEHMRFMAEAQTKRMEENLNAKKRRR